MKNYIGLLLGIALLPFLGSCSEETAINRVSKGITSGGVLRVLKVTNSLEVKESSSVYSVFLEAQTENNGKLLKEVRVSVGYYGVDTVKASLYSTIPAADFNKMDTFSTNHLPITEFKVTLQDLVKHVKKTQSQLSHSNKFLLNFEMELTDGRVYNSQNASSDITQTGTFSYFNSQFSYTLAINAKETRITGFNKQKRIRKEVKDTVFITFNDSKRLVSRDPFFKVTPISANSAEVTVGKPAEKIDTIVVKGNNTYKYRYYFIYTASSEPVDYISFMIEDAAVYSKSITMDSPVTLNLFIVDNVLDVTASKPEVVLDGDSIASVAINFNFAEVLRSKSEEGDTAVFAIKSNAFDNQVIKQAVGAKMKVLMLNFMPMATNARIAIPTGKLDFTVKVTGAKDETGNEIDKSISFSLFR